MEKELDLCKTVAECMEIYTKNVNYLNEVYNAPDLRSAVPFRIG